MSARIWAGTLIIAGAALAARPAAPVASATPAAVQDQTTTLDDQSELALTVYNSDIALVRDVRQLQLARGTASLRFMDIAATVNPATVHFRSLTEPSRVSVLEQNYEYDLLEPDKLLRKYVGRDVTLVRTRQEDGSTVQEEVTARLLSYNTAPVWRIGNEIVTGMHADHIRFPELPETLFSRPTLIWTVENEGAARHRVEASYLAGKLAWNADYVLTVSRDDKAADVDGWVTLTNNSGTAFRNAKLQLVAGDLNRVRQVLGRMVALEEDVARAEAPAPMTQESFSDYHLYTLGRKTTINNSQTKQVSMLEGSAVPIKKRYVVEGQCMLLPQPGTPRLASQGCRPGVLPVQERGEGRPRHADAGGHGARLPGGFDRRGPVRRRGSHQPYAEGRDAEPEDRERLRRDRRAQADRLREDREQRLRSGLRDHASQPQGGADHRGGERAGRWHLADDPELPRAHEDGGVGGAVPGASGRQTPRRS